MLQVYWSFVRQYWQINTISVMQTYKRLSTKAFCSFVTYKRLLFLHYRKNSPFAHAFSVEQIWDPADVRSTTFVTWMNWPIGSRKTEIVLSSSTLWKFANRPAQDASSKKWDTSTEIPLSSDWNITILDCNQHWWVKMFTCR